MERMIWFNSSSFLISLVIFEPILKLDERFQYVFIQGKEDEIVKSDYIKNCLKEYSEKKEVILEEISNCGHFEYVLVKRTKKGKEIFQLMLKHISLFRLGSKK